MFIYLHIFHRISYFTAVFIYAKFFFLRSFVAIVVDKGWNACGHSAAGDWPMVERESSKQIARSTHHNVSTH